MIDQDVSYKPLIQDFTWSYSRISSYYNCKWKFFLRYIRESKEREQFYSSYGKFMHQLIERFYKKELTKSEMLMEFLLGYKDNVVGTKPPNVSGAAYIEKGVQYLRAFEPFPYEMVDVEKEVNFTVEGIPFTGFIDFLGKDENGDFVIIDNKSRDLKPRSGRAKPTTKDKELDQMLRQLYIYAIAVKEIYGKWPVALCFNCFKNQQFIIEEFDMNKCEEATQWVVDSVHEIEENMNWDGEYDFFTCNYICGLNHKCEIFAEEKGW